MSVEKRFNFEKVIGGDVNASVFAVQNGVKSNVIENISDLTNTIWIINNSPSYEYIEANINFTSNNKNYVKFLMYSTDDIYYVDSNQNSDWVATSTDNPDFSVQAYRIIKITGGNDVTNSTLISWLEASATQVQVDEIAFDGSMYANWKVNGVLQDGRVFKIKTNDVVTYQDTGGVYQTGQFTVYDINYQEIDSYRWHDYTAEPQPIVLTSNAKFIIFDDDDDNTSTAWKTLGTFVILPFEDLTGTKWIFKSIIDISGDAFNAKEIIFKSISTFPNIEEYTYGGFRKRTNYLGETYLVYCDDPTEVDMPEEYAYGETSHWGSQILRIIEITGGNDVSNHYLMSWLYTNATLVEVVDLSGTEWVFNNSVNWWSNDDPTGRFYSINFTSEQNTYNGLDFTNVGDDDREYILQYQPSYVYVFQKYFNSATLPPFTLDFVSGISENYKSISITNGTDIANPDLIVWLTKNATLQSQPTPPTPTTNGSISVGSLSFAKVFLGNLEVQKIFYGSVKVYEQTPAPIPQLATPTISLSEDTLTIEEVENAEYYDIYVDGVLEHTIDNRTPQGFNVTITIQHEFELQYKSSFKIYDGQDNTGALLFESSGANVSTPTPITVICSSGYLYFEETANNQECVVKVVIPTLTPSPGITCTYPDYAVQKYTIEADGNIVFESVDYDY